MKLKLILTAAVVGVVASLLGVQTAAAATANICIATNGEVRVQEGTAFCDASGTGSVAIAKGDGSSATATGGNQNRALAIGDGSTAFAGGGDNNTATVYGDSSPALASTATTTPPPSPATSAPPSRARRGQADNNTATVTGDGSDALAGGSTTPPPSTATTAPPRRWRQQHRHRHRRRQFRRREGFYGLYRRGNRRRRVRLLPVGRKSARKKEREATLSVLLQGPRSCRSDGVGDVAGEPRVSRGWLFEDFKRDWSVVIRAPGLIRKRSLTTLEWIVPTPA